MTDLTKYLGNEGLIIDENFHFRGGKKSIDSLINELTNDGLVVDYINTTGELVRVPVRAGVGVRPDKFGERSGWYVFNETGDYQNCVWGNWRTGLQGKWSSVDVNTLNSSERQVLKSKLDEAIRQGEEDKKRRQDEVAKEVNERFKLCNDIVEHPYLSAKKLKNNYGLKELNGNLIIPVANSTTGELRSLQYISKKGEKRFVSASEVKGNVFPIGFSLNSVSDIQKIVVVEGVATGISVHLATGLPVIVVFSATFGLDALTKLRERTKAQFIISFDNDSNAVGQNKAQECASAVHNSIIRLPSVTGDFNDLHLEQGLEAVKLEIEGGGLGIKQYSIKNLIGSPPPIEWLVDRFIPLKSPGVLSSVGGIGKSFLALQLALNLAKGEGKFLGKNILQTGSSVVLSSEDNQEEIHRRINALDQGGDRFNSPYDVYVYTIADHGKPMILLTEDNITAQAVELVEELKTIPDLKLVVFDPIQSFVSANSPISSSNESAQLWCSFCASISAQLGVTTLSIHHMNKSGLVGTESSMEARQSIRGASSIVDGMRFALAMWLSNDYEQICIQEGVKPEPTRVVRASVVKTNSGDVDTSVMTLFRGNDSPVLDVLNKETGIKWD